MSDPFTLRLTMVEAAQVALVIARLDDERLLSALAVDESECAQLIDGLSVLSTQLTLQGMNPQYYEPQFTKALIAVTALGDALQLVQRQQLDDDDDEPPPFTDPDDEDCELCIQEDELEPGTFTPHEHAAQPSAAADTALDYAATRAPSMTTELDRECMLALSAEVLRLRERLKKYESATDEAKQKTPQN